MVKVNDPKIIDLIKFLLQLKNDSQNVLKRYSQFMPERKNKTQYFAREINRYTNDTIEANIKALTIKRNEVIIAGWKNTLNSETFDFLQKIEQTIKRLDSFWVYGGRRKAAKIREALNHLYDGIVQGYRPENIHALLNYKKGVINLNSIFATKALSLNEALSLHRYPELDKFLDIKAPKSKLR